MQIIFYSILLLNFMTAGAVVSFSQIRRDINAHQVEEMIVKFAEYQDNVVIIEYMINFYLADRPGIIKYLNEQDLATKQSVLIRYLKDYDNSFNGEGVSETKGGFAYNLKNLVSLEECNQKSSLNIDYSGLLKLDFEEKQQLCLRFSD